MHAHAESELRTVAAVAVHKGTAARGLGAFLEKLLMAVIFMVSSNEDCTTHQAYTTALRGCVLTQSKPGHCITWHALAVPK